MSRSRPRSLGGIYLESTKAERLGVLPGEDRLVRDVMSRRVVQIGPSASLPEAVATMQREQVSSLAVADEAGFHGLVLERDVARQIAREGGRSTKTVAAILGRKKGVFCREDAIVADALSVMKKRRVSALPVLNEQGAVIGLLSLVDVAATIMPDAASAWLGEVRSTR